MAVIKTGCSLTSSLPRRIPRFRRNKRRRPVDGLRAERESNGLIQGKGQVMAKALPERAAALEGTRGDERATKGTSRALMQNLS